LIPPAKKLLEPEEEPLKKFCLEFEIAFDYLRPASLPYV